MFNCPDFYFFITNFFIDSRNLHAEIDEEKSRLNFGLLLKEKKIFSLKTVFLGFFKRVCSLNEVHYFMFNCFCSSLNIMRNIKDLQFI